MRPNDGGLKMPFGKDVFINACKYMVSEVKDILKKNRLTLRDRSFISSPIRPIRGSSRQLVEALGLHNGELIMNIEDTGNTGCASTADRPFAELEKIPEKRADSGHCFRRRIFERRDAAPKVRKRA